MEILKFAPKIKKKENIVHFKNAYTYRERETDRPASVFLTQVISISMSIKNTVASLCVYNSQLKKNMTSGWIFLFGKMVRAESSQSINYETNQ